MSTYRTISTDIKPSPRTEHCELCGRPDPMVDEAYTTCCNELVCYGGGCCLVVIEVEQTLRNSDFAQQKYGAPATETSRHRSTTHFYSREAADDYIAEATE